MAGQGENNESLEAIVHKQQADIDRLKNTVLKHENILKLICSIFKVQKFKKNEVKSLVDTLDTLVSVDYERNKAVGKRKAESNPPVKKILFNTLKQARLDHKLLKTYEKKPEILSAPSTLPSHSEPEKDAKENLKILDRDPNEDLSLIQLKSQLPPILEPPKGLSSVNKILTGELEEDEDGFVYIKNKPNISISSTSQNSSVPFQPASSHPPHRESYRSKSSRTQLTGYSCPDCSGFFDAFSKHHDRQKLLNLCSEHKYKYPPTNTPPEYYTLETHQSP
jgi:hypothetical protein